MFVKVPGIGQLLVHPGRPTRRQMERRLRAWLQKNGLPWR